MVIARLLGIALFFTLALPPRASASPLGINLSSVSYYASELSFTDLFKQSQPWVSQEKGPPYGKRPSIDTDENGYPLSLAPDTSVDTLIARINGHYPAGKYRLSFSGSGLLQVDFDARGVFTSGGKYELDVTPSSSGLAIRILETDPADPITDISLKPLSSDGLTSGTTFRFPFLARWAGFGVLRFMDRQQTNNSDQQHWEDRPLPTYQTQGGPSGTALEYMIELANELQADPWFCMPHLATDDYVREFAAMVRDTLDPNLKVYIEYSNECWNSLFEQAAYCRNQGRSLGLAADSFTAQLRYYAKRSTEIFDIWEETFGARTRLVRVLSAQFATPNTSAVILEQAGGKGDLLAVAPYFGGGLGSPDTAAETAQKSTEEVLTICHEEILAQAPVIAEHAALAASHGMQLGAYEGGQHLVGYGGAENNTALTELFTAANRSEAMTGLYLDHLRTWQANGGGLYMLFSSMTLPNKWGSWGLLEFEEQDPSSAPKYRAAEIFMQESSQPSDEDSSGSIRRRIKHCLSRAQKYEEKAERLDARVERKEQKIAQLENEVLTLSNRSDALRIEAENLRCEAERLQ